MSFEMFLIDLLKFIIFFSIIFGNNSRTDIVYHTSIKCEILFSFIVSCFKYNTYIIPHSMIYSNHIHQQANSPLIFTKSNRQALRHTQLPKPYSVIGIHLFPP